MKVSKTVRVEAELEMVQHNGYVSIREKGVAGGVICRITAEGIRLAADHAGSLPTEGPDKTVVVLKELC